MDRRPFLYALTLCLLVFALAETNAVAAEISGYAFVQDDGSMKVDGRHVILYGIYIPPTSQSCRTFERPITCAPRAALALDFKIGADFVHCEPQSKVEGCRRQHRGAMPRGRRGLERLPAHARLGGRAAGRAVRIQRAGKNRPEPGRGSVGNTGGQDAQGPVGSGKY